MSLSPVAVTLVVVSAVVFFIALTLVVRRCRASARPLPASPPPPPPPPPLVVAAAGSRHNGDITTDNDGEYLALRRTLHDTQMSNNRGVRGTSRVTVVDEHTPLLFAKCPRGTHVCPETETRVARALERVGNTAVVRERAVVTPVGYRCGARRASGSASSDNVAVLNRPYSPCVSGMRQYPLVAHTLGRRDVSPANVHLM